MGCRWEGHEDQVKGMRDNQVRMTGSGMTGELIKCVSRMNWARKVGNSSHLVIFSVKGDTYLTSLSKFIGKAEGKFVFKLNAKCSKGLDGVIFVNALWISVRKSSKTISVSVGSRTTTPGWLPKLRDPGAPQPRCPSDLQIPVTN